MKDIITWIFIGIGGLILGTLSLLLVFWPITLTIAVIIAGIIIAA